MFDCVFANYNALDKEYFQGVIRIEKQLTQLLFFVKLYSFDINLLAVIKLLWISGYFIIFDFIYVKMIFEYSDNLQVTVQRRLSVYVVIAIIGYIFSLVFSVAPIFIPSVIFYFEHKICLRLRYNDLVFSVRRPPIDNLNTYIFDIVRRYHVFTFVQIHKHFFYKRNRSILYDVLVSYIWNYIV